MKQTNNKKDKTMKTLTITLGNQYDSDGFSLTDGISSSFGSSAPQKPLGYTMDGNCRLGWDYQQYDDQLDVAILATLTDGLTRVIVCQKQTSEKISLSPAKTEPCPHCHTYCDSDCQSR